ncbi:hypothetical protein GGI07_003708 [Coemansia sp. Benny D115]|nr:hypothetical protein GGI07_003708 [Coemansia sp. Benny D115]
MWTRSIVPFRHLYENGVLFKGKSIFHKDCKRFARCIMRFLAYHEANGQDAPFKNIFGGGTGDGNRQLEQWLNAMFEQHDYEMAHFLFQCACKMARSYIKSKPSRHVTSEETVYLASADPQISQVLEIIKSYFTQITEFEGLASGARAECDTPNTPNHRPSSANSRPFKPFSSSTAGTNLNTGFLGDTNDNAPYTHGRRMSATLPAIGFSSSFALYPSGEPYSSSALSGTDGSFYNDQQSIFRQQQLLRNQQYAKEREELLRQQLTREQKAIQEHMDRVQRPQIQSIGSRSITASPGAFSRRCFV